MTVSMAGVIAHKFPKLGSVLPKVGIVAVLATFVAGCATNPQQQAVIMQSMADMTAECAKVAQSAQTDMGRYMIMQNCSRTTAAMAPKESKTGEYVLRGLSTVAKAWMGVKGFEALSDFGIAAVQNAGGNHTQTIGGNGWFGDEGSYSQSIGNDGFIGDGGSGFNTDLGIDQTSPPAFPPMEPVEPEVPVEVPVEPPVEPEV